MKFSTLLALIIIWSFQSTSQTRIRKAGENAEAFVQRFLTGNSSYGRVLHEHNTDSTSLILFFQIVPEDALYTVNQENEFVSGIITRTILSVMYSEDSENFTVYNIDTIYLNAGLPCWQPVLVSSMSILDIDSDKDKELCLKLMHPVLPTCNSVTYFSELVYDNFEAYLESKNMEKIPMIIPQSYALQYTGSIVRKNFVF